MPVVTLTDVVGAGRGALELIVDCAREILRRAQATLSPLMAGRQSEPPASTARLAATTQGPHEAVEATKFVAGTPGGGASLGAPAATLPRAYGVNRAVLTARDPCCLFVWWEITPVSRVEALRSLGAEAEGAREVLRVHRGIYPGCRHVDEVLLTPGAERWYVEVEPGDTWTVEVGLRTLGGRFVSLVRSNPVDSPPAEPSDDTAVRWVTVGRQGVTPAAPDWSGQWVPTEASSADLEPSVSRSSEALPFR
jgi:hypothetical protein